MDFDLLQKLIVSNVIETLEGFNWIRGQFKIVFQFSTQAFGTGISYFDNDSNEHIPYYTDSKGRKRTKEFQDKKQIQELLVTHFTNCEDNNETKWIVGVFNVFPDQKCNYEFVWDQELFLQQEYNLARASVTILYEKFYEILTFEILEEKRWETAIVTSLVKNNSVTNMVEVIMEGQKFNYNLVLPKIREENLLKLHEKTNVGILKDKWPKWNTMKIKLLYEDRFDLDKDVSFTVE